MAIFKCKMCGGMIEFNQGDTVGICDSCGTKQTLPRLDDDKKANLYDRANHFRRNNDYDKAMGIYEQILNEDNTDSEAYWSLVLCRYGIEYVEDPSTHKRVPTVNRAQFTSIFDDDNYKQALHYADSSQSVIYEQEATLINEIQKGILAISQKEEPFDVFICYKETDNNGRRTQDSVLANDLYHQLTQEGFKVFFSRITLEDKLGTAYEPYIFAALNSAKVMVVIGTRPENFNAVWVKNEWSRFLALVKNDSSKVLIPAYRDMDPYDLPEEFSHLQAQDMSKLGFMQDLIRGIKKITDANTGVSKSVNKETSAASTGNANVDSLLKRVFIFLEDGNWSEADAYCERVLDINPECGEAYLGKLMAELEVTKREKLADMPKSIRNKNNFNKVIRFGDDKLKAELNGYEEHIVKRNEKARLDALYNKAIKLYEQAKDAHTQEAYESAANAFQKCLSYKDSKTKNNECKEEAEISRKDKIYSDAIALMKLHDISQYEKAIEKFHSISEWKDTQEQVSICYKKIEELKEEAEISRKDKIYEDAINLMNANTILGYEDAIKIFRGISDWKDADSQIYTCQRKIEEIKAKKEAERLEQERRAEAERLEWERKAEAERIAAEKAKAKKIKRMKIAIPAVCVCIAFVVVLITVIIPNSKYNNAIDLINEEKYVEAYEALSSLDGYKDSADKMQEICKEYIEKQLSNVEVGGTITFGSYEQDNDVNNGKEDIEWRVLKKQNNKILVISKYGLDYKNYNNKDEEITWENCTLRKWLNEEFLKIAFDKIEQNLVISTSLENTDDSKYNTSGGEDTIDKVFLFSIEEARRYFLFDNERRCILTEYAKAQAESVSEDNGWYWLRSSGNADEYNCAAGIDDDGNIDAYGYYVNFECAVRPALWINLEY